MSEWPNEFRVYRVDVPGLGELVTYTEPLSGEYESRLYVSAEEYRAKVEPIVATTIASSLFIHREHVAKHVAAAFDAIDGEQK